MPELSDPDKVVVAGYANRLEMVRWDRFVWYVDEDEHRTLFLYGWIPRDDGKSDFVILLWLYLDLQKFPHAWTSSAEHTRGIAQRLYHDQEWWADDQHVECERVEDHFAGLIDNAVKL